MSVVDERWKEVLRAADEAGIAAEPGGALGARTTYRVGGTASVVLPLSAAGSIGALGSLPEDVPTVILGQGSNTLVADAGFAGVAIVIGAGDGASRAEESIAIERNDDRVVMSVDGAARLPVVARRTVARGCCGAEWMVGVPGSIGGAVCMNAGGHGADMASMLLSAEVHSLRTGRSATILAQDLGLRFRGSALSGHHVVMSACFALFGSPSHEGPCDVRLTEIVSWRREHQPGGQNAGSVFVNPGDGERSAGALIDGCDLRGFRIGTATVSEKHANFIQADPGGRADDVVQVMCRVQDQVFERHGVMLRSEIRLVGFDAEMTARFAVHDHYDVDDDEVATSTARLDALL